MLLIKHTTGDGVRVVEDTVKRLESETSRLREEEVDNRDEENVQGGENKVRPVVGRILVTSAFPHVNVQYQRTSSRCWLCK